MSQSYDNIDIDFICVNCGHTNGLHYIGTRLCSHGRTPFGYNLIAAKVECKCPGFGTMTANDILKAML